MSFVILAQVISITANVLIAVVFIWAVLSWVAPPYNPVREMLDRIIEPLLAPIRRVVPMTGPVDFSPMILMVLIILVTRILTGIILSL
jgi:YggT family protein